jgi:hypothetical protein
MKVRNGFVSNSSSSSFIIPKKYLDVSELIRMQDAMDDVLYENEFIRDYPQYICGRISRYHPLNDILTKYQYLDGVDYFDD